MLRLIESCNLSGNSGKSFVYEQKKVKNSFKPAVPAASFRNSQSFLSKSAGVKSGNGKNYLNAEADELIPFENHSSVLGDFDKHNKASNILTDQNFDRFIFTNIQNRMWLGKIKSRFFIEQRSNV
jgi:hypothetical protein